MACSGSYHCEKIQQIQGFSIYRGASRLLCLVVSCCRGVNGLILWRVDFLLISFLPTPARNRSHQQQQTPPGGGFAPHSKSRGSCLNIPKVQKRFYREVISLFTVPLVPKTNNIISILPPIINQHN